MFDPRAEQSKERPAAGVLVLLIGALLIGGWFLGTLDSPTKSEPNELTVSATTLGLADTPDRPRRAVVEPTYPGVGSAGNLPDGTMFLSFFTTPQPAVAQRISAGIMVTGTDAESSLLGIVSFDQGAHDDGLASDGVYWRRYGDWNMRVTPDIRIVEAFGSGLEEWLDEHIVSLGGRTLPAFDLKPPLRWATDDELPHPMQVWYSSYVVRRGCGSNALVCSETRAVQLLSKDDVVSPAPELGAGAFISSPAARPVADPAYFDPGPLASRTEHVVAWTGTELLIWGGTDGEKYLLDGGAYSPTGDAWRLLPASPFGAGSRVVGVWAGDRLVAFDDSLTAQYSPLTDRWEILGTGVQPPDSSSRTVWSAGSIYTWSDEIYRFDDGSWTALPAPTIHPQSAWEASLAAFDEAVYAIYLPWGDCSSRQLSRWNGAEWLPIPDWANVTDTRICGGANQVIARYPLLYAWGTNERPMSVYDPRTDTWSDLGEVPITNALESQDPIPLDERFLIPEANIGWLYDPGDTSWTRYQMPGWLRSPSGVWTGTELLFWGQSCCPVPGDLPVVDAWRFRLKD